MIGIFDNSGNRLAITYNGLTLNSPSDSPDSTYEVNTAAVYPMFDQVIDSDPATNGSEVGPVKRKALIVRLEGTIRAQSLAALHDKIAAFEAAFDPALASYLNASTDGVLNFDFSVPTADTANYASGAIACRYGARMRGGTWPVISEYTGFSAFFSVELFVPDAIRVYQTQSTLSGSGTANNSLADEPYWPTITITMAGAGSATYTIQRTGTLSTKSLVLNLSGRAAADVVTVDMASKTISVNGTETPSLYVSGDFWEIEPNSQTITVSNATNATTSTAWRRAWPS